MSKILSGSKVQNPTDLLQGSAVDQLIDRGAQMYSDQQATFTGTGILFTRPMSVRFQDEAGKYHSNTIRFDVVDLFQAIPGTIPLADKQSIVCRLDRTTTNTKSILTAVRVSNITTFTTTVVHGLQLGDILTVSGMTSSTFNGTFKVLTMPTTSSFTVINVGANDTSTINGSLLSRNVILTAAAYSPTEPNLAAGTYSVVNTEDLKDIFLQEKDIVILFRREDTTDLLPVVMLPLHKQLLEAGQTVFLGASGSGGGAGDSLQADMKRRLGLSTYESLHVNDIEIRKDVRIDLPNSTGAYSPADKAFKFTSIGQTMRSYEMLDPEFLSKGIDLQKVEFTHRWKPIYLIVDSIANSGAVRTTNIATIKTTTAHGYIPGQSVVVANVSDASFDGTWVIATTPTGTSFTYANTGVDVAAATAGSGTVNAVQAATYQATRDGVEFQTVSLTQIGKTDTHVGTHTFTEEVTPQTLQTYDVSNANINNILNDSAAISRAQKFAVTHTETARFLTLYLNKLESAGNLTGHFYVRVVRDDAGLPSTDPNDIVKESISYDIDTLATGNISVVVDVSLCTLVAGTYWWEIIPDAEYQSSYLGGTRELRVRGDTTPSTYDGAQQNLAGVWSLTASNANTYLLTGRLLTMKFQVTASAANLLSIGYGALFEPLVGTTQTLYPKEVQRFTFSGDENRVLFTLGFLPDPDLLVVYDPKRGQSYVVDDDVFRIVGFNVTFEPNTFDFPGEEIKLVFSQIVGQGFDNSDQNANAIAEINSNLIDLGEELAALSNSMILPKIPAPFTSIQNRVLMVDLTQDLKSKLAPQRFHAQQLVLMPNELGPNGEAVWGLANDKFGQVRFVGTWTMIASTEGCHPLGATAGDYVEISFAGTGMNCLAIGQSPRDVRASVDGGAPGVNIFSLSSSVLLSRNYSSNEVNPVTTGLTYGMHTVKLTVTTANFHFMGFESFTSESTGLIRINPGSQYNKGKKRTLASQFTTAYNASFDSGVLAARGGRVAIFQKLDGSFGKYVQPTDETSQFINDATNPTDHANEEVARIYNFREFGYGLSTDFQTLTGTIADKSMILDDGVTSLVCNDCNTDQVGVKDALVNAQAAGSFWTFTWVGTGIDIFNAHTLVPSVNFPVLTLDGTQIVSGGTNRFTANSWQRIASGLPYGTHTLKMAQAVGGTGFRVSDFKVYRPMTPAAPANAIITDIYDIPATYVGTGITGTTNAANIQVATGVISKAATREHVFVGAWLIDSPPDPTLFSQSIGGGTDYRTNFWGIGFVIHLSDSSAGTYDYTVSIDGVLNATGVARSNSSNLGGGSYRVTSVVGAQPARVEFTGLSMNKHTIIVTKTAGAGTFRLQAMHLIMPIYSHQNSGPNVYQNMLTVGSSGMTDMRKFTPADDPDKAEFSKASGITSAPTTTSTSYVPLFECSNAIYTTKRKLRVKFQSPFTTNAGNQDVSAAIYLDGIRVAEVNATTPSATYNFELSMNQTFPIAPGFHQVFIFWKTNAGTATASGNTAATRLIELEGVD